MHRKSTPRKRQTSFSATSVGTKTSLFSGRSASYLKNCPRNRKIPDEETVTVTSYQQSWHIFFNGPPHPFFVRDKNSSTLASTQKKRELKGYGTMERMCDATHAEEQDNCNDGGHDRECESNGPMTPLEMEGARRQMRISKVIRFSAIGMCAFVVVSIGLVCFVGIDTPNSTQKQTFPSSGTSSRSRFPKVQQPVKKIVEDESLVRKLREEFHEWIHHHGRNYGSKSEKEKRFHIWKENHYRTEEKNQRHGPCKMTGQAVFGSNHFKDLSPEEFQSQYLTGYTGPHTDKMPHDARNLRSDQLDKKDNKVPNSNSYQRRSKSNEVLSSNGLHDPSVDIKRHNDVQERYLKYMEDAPMLGKTYYNKEEKQNERVCKCGTNYNSNDYSGNSNRNLLGIKTPMFGKTYYNKSEKQQICGYSKTYYSSSSSSSIDCSKYKLEAGKDFETSDSFKESGSSCAWYDASCFLRHIFQPIYTSSSERYYSDYNYPSSMDWRQMGAVTSVHSQGSCGACWAITAVETIESAYFIKSNQLLDLSESEVIICDTSCEMCDGGWPQNAYEYVKENKGIPMESGYDGDLLMTMTTVRAGTSDELTEAEIEAIEEQSCPSSANEYGANSSTRYAAIKGYAYATDRCVCYTDGSGCDCDEQNEALAVMNVASYGPATVCLEASTWQDYTGGIITAESGCTSAFLDMNHCVQTVGYAFQEVDGDDENDKSGSHDGGDGGNKKLEGYWIIRNQWSSYWGMNGYAWVAMGSNTCGVLNDMTQVFLD